MRASGSSYSKEMVKVTAKLVLKATAEIDPTFAAIEAIKRHQRRMEVLSQTNDDVNLPAYFAAVAARDDALDELCCTVPTTIAGARAAIEYVMHVEDAQEIPAARAYIENLLASPILSPIGGYGSAPYCT
jgi:hypothetical protein